MDKEPIQNHMDSPPENREPDPRPDFDKDIYPCPKNFPPDKWAKWGKGNQRAYWKAITNKPKPGGHG